MSDAGSEPIEEGVGLLDAGLMGLLSDAIEIQAAGDGEPVTIPDPDLLFNGDFGRRRDDLIITDEDGRSVVVLDYFRSDQRSWLQSPDGALLSPEVVEVLAGPANPGQYAQAAQAQSGARVIGRVERASGTTLAVRNGAQVTLNVGDPVYENDAVQTGANSALGISFIDGTAFSLSANARLVLNRMVYEPNGSANASMMSIVQGTISFVAGQVAKTGDMKVATPVATMGIRGTAVEVQVQANNGEVTFKVMREPNGTVGSIQLLSITTGLPIATLSNAEFKLILTPQIGAEPRIETQAKTVAEIAAEAATVSNVFGIQAQGIAPPPTAPDNQTPNDPNAPPPERRGDNSGGNGGGQTQNAAVGSSTPNDITKASDSTNAPGTAVIVLTPIGGGTSGSLFPTDSGLPEVPRIEVQDPEIPGTAPVRDEPDPITATIAFADVRTDEDQPMLITVPGAGFAALGASRQITATLADGSPLPSWLTFDPVKLTLTGTPPENQAVSLALRITGSDGAAVITATLNIEVVAVNDAPVIIGAFTPLAAEQGQELSGTLRGGIDPEGTPLTFALVAGSVEGGTVVIDPATGDYTFKPDPTFVGTARFRYAVNDGDTSSEPATVTIDVAPSPKDDLFELIEDQFPSLFFAPAALLANDGRAGMPSLVPGSAKGGTATQQADGTIVFSPDQHFSGLAEFSYQIGKSAPAKALILVNPFADVPILTLTPASGSEGGVISLSIAAPVLTDTDSSETLVPTLTIGGVPDGATLSAGTSLGGGLWSLAFADLQGLTLTLPAEWDDSFNLTVSATTIDTLDLPALGISRTSRNTTSETLQVTVAPVNDAPVADAQPESAEGREDEAVIGRLRPGSDADGDPLTFVLVDGSAENGTVTLDASTGAYTFTPAPGYNGPASFQYVVTDGALSSAPKTVTIAIAPQNDAPSASVAIEIAAGPEDAVVTGTLLAGLDPDGDPLIFQLVTPPQTGTLSLNQATGAYAFTPAPNFSGTASFQYVVSDGLLTSLPKTVTITVSPVNDAPVIAAGSEDRSGLEGESIAGTLLPGTDADLDALMFELVSAPENGTLTFDPTSGAYRFTPAPNFSGETSFQYRLSDGQAASAIKTVTLTIVPVNDAPATAPASEDREGSEDAILTGTLLPGVDPDQDNLTFVLVGTPTNGAITLNPITGAYVFTPSANASGTASFQYAVSDGVLTSAPKTVTIAITPVNDAPTASPLPEAYSGEEDGTVLGILRPGTDVDGDTLTYILVPESAQNGTVVLNPTTGSFLFTPAPGHSGPASFQYAVSDGFLISGPKTVALTIAGTNDRPAAGESPENREAAEDTVVTGTLLQGSDPDGDPLTFQLVSNSAVNGTVTLNAQTGTYTFTPAPDFSGTASFQYVVSDGRLTSEPKTVNIEVLPVNDAPVAATSPETNAGPEGQPISGTLLTGSDADGDQLTFALVDGSPVNGTVVLNRETGAYTFTPVAGYSGPASFQYVVRDSEEASAPKTVSLAISSVNTPPETSPEPEDRSGFEDVPLTGTLRQGSDADQDPLTFAFVDGSAVNGTVTIDATTGTYTFTPAANAFGIASFQYVVSDGLATSEPKTVTLTLAAVNDAPTLAPSTETAAGIEDQPITGRLLAGSDVDGDSLAFQLVGEALNGTVSIDAATGDYTFLPAPGYNGPASFQYRVTDGSLASAPKTVTITIASANDAPLVSPASERATGNEDAANAGTLLPGSDPDGDTLTFVLVPGSAQNGTVTLDATGAYTFTPAPNFHGEASFAYRVSDGQLTSATKIVTITVLPVNDAPATASGSENRSGIEDTAVQGVLLQGSDIDGDVLTFEIVGTPENGAVELDGATGEYVFTPVPGFFGQATFQYRVSDGEAASAVKTVTITFGGDNDAPTPNPGNEDRPGTEDEFVTGSILTGQDPDGDTLTYLLVEGSLRNGSVTLDRVTGSYIFTPDPDFHGEASFAYQVSDGTAVSEPKTIVLAIAPVNDAPETSPADENRTGVEDKAVTGTLLDGSDVDGDPLTFAVVGDAQNGTVDLNPDTGTYIFTPRPGFSGVAGFTYVVRDGTTVSLAKTVTITFGSDNDAPEASPEPEDREGFEDMPITGVLHQGSDPDGDDLAFVLEPGSALNGTVTLDPATGAYTFTPEPDFHGTASFQYRVSDGNALSDPKTVTLNIAPGAPIVAGDDVFTVAEDGTLAVGAADGLLVNDSGGEGGLQVAAGTAVTLKGGTVTISADGSFTYAAPADFSGQDSFTYTVRDGLGGPEQATATVRINVGAVNDPPEIGGTLANDPVTDKSVTKPFRTITIADRDSATLTVRVQVNPAQGAFTASSLAVSGFTAQGSAGTYLFTGPTSQAAAALMLLEFRPVENRLPPGGTETVTFALTLEDGSSVESDDTTTVVVTSINDAPAAAGDAAETNEDASVVFDVVANDADPDIGQELVVTDAVIVEGEGVVAVAGNGLSLAYDPGGAYQSLAEGESATVRIRYTLSDGASTTTAIAVVTVTGRADTTTGTPGPDTLIGTAFADQIEGLGGDDQMAGLAGNDILDGGAGTDRVDYRLDAQRQNASGALGTGGVIVNLSNAVYVSGAATIQSGTARDGYGSIDTLISIEEVFGTAAADTLIGGAGSEFFWGAGSGDLLHGGANNDGLQGGRGSDTINGGDGADEVSYGDYDGQGTLGLAGITFSLAGLEGGASKTYIDPWGGTDTLTSIERVRGTMWDDSLTGNGENNRFRGLRGNDTIDGGGGGSDRLDYLVEHLYEGSSGGVIVNMRSDASFTGTLGAVTVTLAARTARDTFGTTDSFMNIESAVGSIAADILVGSLGAESWLDGRGGNDLIISNAGGDWMTGGAGEDTLNGAAVDGSVIDDETVGYIDEEGPQGVFVNLSGTAQTRGGITVAAGRALDSFGHTDRLIDIEEVLGTRFADVLIGGNAGNDTFELFVGFDGADTIEGGTGADRVAYHVENRYGGSMGVIVNLSDQNRSVAGYGTILKNTARDTFGFVDTFGFADAGGLSDIEEVEGSQSHDLVFGSVVSNRFRGNDGNDTFEGGGGTDTIDYSRELDRGGESGVIVNLSTDAVAGVLAGQARDTFGRTDVLTSIESVIGSGASDRIVGGAAAGTLGVFYDGREGNDEIDGAAANESLYGGTGNDTLRGGGGDDVLFGHDGADSLLGGAAGDYLDGAAGNDTLQGGAGSDVLIGGAGNDDLDGDADDDYLEGGAGDDTLDGGTGDDYLQTGTGSDRVYGGDGFDIAAFRLPEGSVGTLEVVVDDVYATILLNGVEIFAIAPGDPGYPFTVVDLRSDTSLVTEVGRDVEEIHVLIPDDSIDGFSELLVLNLAVNTSPFDGGLHVQGTYFGDAIDVLDEVPGVTLQTVVNVNGETGDDTIAGHDGQNGINGGAGDDFIQGRGGRDYLAGDEGDDTLDGGAGNDYLQTGIGSDRVFGGTGFDVAGFRLPVGTPGTLTLAVEGSTASIFLGGAVIFTVSTGTATAPFAVTDLRSSPPVTTLVARDVEQIHFVIPHPTDWSMDQVLSLSTGYSTTTEGDSAHILGTFTGDFIDVASELPDFGPATFIDVNGEAGDDVVIGHAGANILFGDLGNDDLRGLGGEDNLFGAEGNDTLRGGEGADYLQGDEGSDWLQGGGGNDVAAFVFEGSPGEMAIVHNATGAIVTAGGVAVLDIRRVDAGWTVEDLRAGSPLGKDTIALDVEEIVVNGYFEGFPLQAAVTVSENGPGAFRVVGTFASDTLDVGALIPEADSDTNVSVEAGQGNDTVVGHAGSNLLIGDQGNDRLIGLAGDDSLFGGLGRDELYGGSGADYLSGGSGDDFLSVGDVGGIAADEPADVVLGDEGDDTFEDVSNGFVEDVLYGGAGMDTYTLRWSAGGAPDQVMDFASGSGGDIIELRHVLWNLQGYAPNEDPFLTGHVRLLTNGSFGSLLQIDRDGAGGSDDRVTILSLVDVMPQQFTTANYRYVVDTA